MYNASVISVPENPPSIHHPSLTYSLWFIYILKIDAETMTPTYRKGHGMRNPGSHVNASAAGNCRLTTEAITASPDEEYDAEEPWIFR